MGRAEARGNQQQQTCSSGRQKTRQDRTQAALGGRLLGESSGNGCLESCAQSKQQQGESGASKQRSVPLVVRCSAQHQEGPSRSCSASSSASACSATTQEPRRSPSVDHGTASLAYINNIPHYSCSSCCLDVYIRCIHSIHRYSTAGRLRERRQSAYSPLLLSSHT